MSTQRISRTFTGRKGGGFIGVAGGDRSLMRVSAQGGGGKPVAVWLEPEDARRAASTLLAAAERAEHNRTQAQDAPEEHIDYPWKDFPLAQWAITNKGGVVARQEQNRTTTLAGGGLTEAPGGGTRTTAAKAPTLPHRCASVRKGSDMNVVRFWGQDAEEVFARLPAGTEYYKEKSGPYAIRGPAADTLPNSAAGALIVSRNPIDDLMTTATIRLHHPSLSNDATYIDEVGIGFPVEVALYQYTKGNFSCDCNRSLFLQNNGYPDFPDLECGHEIELISISITRSPVKWSIKE